METKIIKYQTKMKKLFLFCAFVAISLSAAAQISTGAPSASVVKTGNRPSAGDFGIFLGAGVNLQMTAQDAVRFHSWYVMPTINVKYFLTDNLELRAGLDMYRNTNKNVSGKLIGVVDVYDQDLKVSDKIELDVDGLFKVTPGAAWHFSKSNILDVYFGAEIPIGIEHHSSHYKPDSRFDELKVSRAPFTIGLNAVIGLQAFLGHLPMAIGLEYGIGAAGYLGNQWKFTATKNGNTATFYSEKDLQPSGNQLWLKLSSSRGSIYNTFRITFSYYFR